MDSNKPIGLSNATALILSLILIAIFIIGGYVIVFKCEAFGPGQQPQLAEGAEKEVSKFVRLYVGLTNVTVNGEEFKNDEWIFNVSAKGITEFNDFEVRTDSNLTPSSFRILGKINVPKAPATYQESYALSCKADKSFIDIYVDPYDPWSRTYFNMTNDIADRFSDSAVKRFHVVNPYTSQLEGYRDAVKTSQYMVCIRNDSNSAFISMTRCVFKTINETGMIMNDTALDNCASLSGMKMSNDSLKACIDNESVGLLTDDGNFALSSMPEISTRYVTFNCKYNTFPMYLDVAMCYLEPDMPACKNVS